MMAPEEDGELRVDPKRTQDTADNQQEADRGSPVRRARRQSEAERRDEREQQRNETHQNKTRLSILHNRFLTRKDSKNDGHSPTKQTPPKSPRGSPKKRAQQQPEEDNDGEDVDDSPSIVEEENALVVTRRKSSAAASVTGATKRDRRRSSSAKGAVATPHREPADATKIITTPAPHMFPSMALRRSNWTRELDEDAACGLYVADEQRELAQVASSTLMRLEERLQREQLLAKPSSDSDTSAYAKLRLNDLIQTIQLATGDSDDRYNQLEPVYSSRTAVVHPSAETTALLEVVVDRLVLDDHASFSLADRLETQMRSLYTSYTQLLHAQPWRVLLQRIDAFVDAHLQNQAATDSVWHRQTASEVQDLLQTLTALQQLHYQLLGKWHELQDCYRQPALAARSTRLRVEIQERATPLTLAIVHAFLEIDTPADTATAHDGNDRLTRRLDELETKDQHLHAVLVMTVMTGASPGAHQQASTPSTPRASWTCLPSLPTLQSLLPPPPPPQFYVVLCVNGNEVGRTSASNPQTVGVVVFREVLRAQLQYFPSSATVNVYERGLIVDTLLSTTAIPLLIPGFDLVHANQRIAAASLAPTREWYQFSSVHSVPRSRWHPTFLNSSSFATFDRRPHGRVRVQVAWVANSPASDSDNQLAHDDDEATAYLPPRRLAVANSTHANSRLIGPRVDRRQSDTNERYGHRRQLRHAFSYERDFLVHVAGAEGIDRLDPQNAAMVRLHDHVASQSVLLRHRDVFRTSALAFDGSLTPTPWHSSGRAALTNRNLLLQLRDRQHVAAHGTSVILSTGTDLEKRRVDDALFAEPLPLTDSEILTNAKFLTLLRPELPAFDHRQQLDDALAAGDRFSLERQRRLQLLKLHDFVARVKASQVGVSTGSKPTAENAATHRSKSLASIIQEQPLPLLPGDLDLSGLQNLFAPRRRLRPRVEKRAAPATKADWPRQCTLYVQIKSATNIPVRVSVTPGLKPPALEADASSNNSSHVFVELSFQGRRRRTTSTYARSSTGAVWMESLALPFLAPQNDWSPHAIQQAQDVVHVSLFDQLVHADARADDSLLLAATEVDPLTTTPTPDRKQSFHQENRYLGRLAIPFTTLYHNGGTLDATLRCEMPVANAGYTNARLTADESPAASAGEDDGVAQSSREATFLSVMMTLDPPLPLPPSLYDESNVVVAGEGGASLTAYARQWATATQQLNASTRHRDFHVFVRNVSHGQTFLTRYITPQSPPPLPLSNGAAYTVSQLVHFVRLIPFLDDWHLFTGRGDVDVWTTSQELLELNAGDYEEHAVLLCNYLQWLDRHEPSRKSFLLLATAVPEGKTVYVLRQDSYKIPQRSVVWNASSGVGYSVLDDRCPLLDVSLAVSSDNIFANIQPKQRASEMNWDIETNTKAWKPFFHAGFKRDTQPLSSVQPPELEYVATPVEYTQQVELELRETLKLEIRRWRSVKYTTTFNMDLSIKLRGQLERLEAAMRDGITAKRRSKETDPIQELMTRRRVSGMPLHTSFTDVATVVGMVKNTNIYWNDHSEVEFGLAVYVHAYPNYVLSVWLYLAAVEPRD